MTYAELKKATNGKTFPLAGKNSDGENVIVEHGQDEQKFFKLTTSQKNGWLRINYIYEDGTSEELYEK